MKFSGNTIKTLDDLKSFVESNKDNLYLKDKNDNYILHICCHFGTLEMLMFLLEKIKEDEVIYHKNKFDNDIYICSIAGGNDEIAQFLENNYGFSLSEENISRCYIWAVTNGNLNMIKRFEKKYNIDVKNIKNECHNPFTIASFRGHIHVMEYYEKEYGYNVDCICSCEHGLNVYFCAIPNEKINVMKYLEKKYNYDIFTKNKSGGDAYDVAEQLGKKKVMQYLEETHDFTHVRLMRKIEAEMSGYTKSLEEKVAYLEKQLNDIKNVINE